MSLVFIFKGMVMKYEIGSYYEFSDAPSFKFAEVGMLMHYSDGFFSSKCGNKTEWFKFIRQLSAPIGKITEIKPLSGFVNVYKGERVSIMGFLSRGKADAYAVDREDERVACIDLSKFKEGEGL